MKTFYDPNFYEYTALQYLAKELNTPIKTSVKWPDLNLPLSQRNELDGLLEINNEKIVIEVKSYPLSAEDIKTIYLKYNNLKFKKIFLIAPEFHSINNRNIKLIKYIPNIERIYNFYIEKNFNLTNNISKELSNGWHHFRFRLIRRAKQSQSRYINQTDKRIKNNISLKREITERLPKNNPPVKILWSLNRWLSPKDLFFKKQDNYYLGGPLIFDIDGHLIHRAYMPCEISPEHGLCEACFFFAKRETVRLLSFLRDTGFKNIEIYFSGKSGFHVYVFDADYKSKNKLFRDLKERKIRVDQSININLKSDISFPQTVNANSYYLISKVEDIKRCFIKDLYKI